MLYRAQGRATKTQRLPLLLLVCAGVPTVAYFVSALRAGGTVSGNVVLAAGYAIAVVAELQALRGAPNIAHGG